MIYLVAIFLPPLALLIYGKIFQAIVNFLICVIAIVVAFFFLFIAGAPGWFIWGIAVVHAILAVNSAKEDQRAEMIADAMRSKNN